MPETNQSATDALTGTPEVLMAGPDLNRPNPGGVVTVMRDLMSSNIGTKITYRHLPYDVNGTRIQKLIKYVLHRMTLKWEARSGNSDILHFHTSLYPTLGHVYSFYASLTQSMHRRGGKSIVSLHGGVPSETKHAKKELLQFARAVDTILILTPRQKEELIEMDGALEGKIRMVPNFTHSVSCTTARDLSQNKFLFLGSLIKRKGVQELGEALNNIKGSLPDDFKLTIAGTGEEKARLKKQVQRDGLDRYVDFVGYLDKRQKYQAICENTFMILPSRSEAFPMAILESMSAGCIILATTVGAVDLIIDGNGIVCAPNSADEIGQMIIKALKLNQEERIQMSGRSRTLFNEKYDLATSAADFYIDLYLGVLPEHS